MPEHFALENQASSHNHHFMGDVARFYIAWLAGLHIKSPTEVELSPRFIGGLTHAEAFYELPLGRVSVSWEKIGDVYRVKAEIPEGVSYTADLPNDAELEIISNKKNKESV